MRSDTAGHQPELLIYCAEEDEAKPCGAIEFAVDVDVTPKSKKALAEAAEEGPADVKA